MSVTALQEVPSLVHGDVLFGEPLARYTTYRIGGLAGALVKPQGVEDVAALMQFCRESGTQWLVLGLGSNVLIADTGFDGLVIRLGRGMDGVRHSAEAPEIWHVGAGLPTPRLARQTARAGMAGVHRLIGVPGTVGGGVFMNAGAHGQEFKAAVRRAAIVDDEGTVRLLDASEISWRYRASGIRGIVTSAELALTPADSNVLFREIRRHFRWRREGTPFDQPCCGSVFRNPAPDTGADGRTAGQLIDAVGLKEFRIGDAQVSSKHANYIVNLGHASASDVMAVIEAVRERVFRSTGIALELEVKIIP